MIAQTPARAIQTRPADDRRCGLFATLRGALSAPAAVTLNRALAGGLLLWAVVDLLFYGSFEGVLVAGPLAALFAIFSVKVSGPDAGWLRASAYASLALTATCALSFVASVGTAPVDVACAVWSSGMTAVFGYASWYQSRISS